MSFVADIYAKLFAKVSHTHTKSEITDFGGGVGFPDFSNQLDIKDAYSAARSTGYVIPFDGWLSAAPASSGNISINGKVVFKQSDAGVTSHEAGIPVKSGDVVSGASASTMVLYPMR